MADSPAPLRPIDCVATPSGGLIGMAAFPGRRPAGGPRAADGLTEDLAAMRLWGASFLVTLAERSEWERLGGPDLPGAAAAQGLRWRHAPIPDMEPPNAATLDAWRAIAPELLAELSAGGRIVLHCAAGLGRTGAMAAVLLTGSGVPAPEAVLRVRAARPGAIETEAQLRFVLQHAPDLPRSR